MLVLSRCVGESIVIGSGPGAIVLTMVSIDPGKIRLGVTAPREIPVWRAEIYEQMKQEGLMGDERKMRNDAIAKATRD